MWDRMIIQAETDFRRERVTRAISPRRRRRSTDGVRIPFIGGSGSETRRVR